MDTDQLHNGNAIFRQVERKQATYTDNSGRFVVKTKNFKQQYSGIYFTRLNMMRKRVLDSARGWDAQGGIYVDRLIHTKTSVPSYVIGTLYVEMPLKRCILDDIAREAWVEAPAPLEKYASDLDSIIIEDESGRMNLTGDVLKAAVLVTGSHI